MVSLSLAQYFFDLLLGEQRLNASGAELAGDGSFSKRDVLELAGLEQDLEVAVR
ncbi:hypothetical protein D9M72_490390 [compost metagenome]